VPETVHLVISFLRYFFLFSLALFTGYAFLDLLKKRQPRPRYIRVLRRRWDRQ